ncbi:unnamed protein product [Auanema sp. JU1783]|nr:unnamed protein product [Auanema sp. JU1783]
MSPVLPEHSQFYEKCNVKAIIKVSKLILENFPYLSFHSLVGGNDQEWSQTLGCSSDELEQILDHLISIWKYIVYHQPKMEAMTEMLEKVTNNTQLSDLMVDIWREQGLHIVSRVGKITMSESPRVRDVLISTDLQLSNDSNKDERRVEATISLSTDNGQKEVKISKEELFRLYEEANKIQKAIDNLLE